MKKFLTLFLVIAVTGFSFFYTEKMVKLARGADPIMIELTKVKKDLKVKNVKPIINKDEYVAGINGCVVNTEESYNKMKQVGKFDDTLVVMKSKENKISKKNKYIVGGNKKTKNVSIILKVDKELSSSLYSYLKDKKVKMNFFIDGYFLDNNLNYVQKLSNISNVYNSGRDSVYDESTIIYDNNILESISNNKSNFCLVDKKNKKTLKLCNDYNMNVIKGKNVSNINELEENLSNGKIFVIDNNMEDMKIKISINHIISKGYNIVTINELISEKNDCNY